jgi:hypothetical protein
MKTEGSDTCLILRSEQRAPAGSSGAGRLLLPPSVDHLAMPGLKLHEVTVRVDEPNADVGPRACSVAAGVAGAHSSLHYQASAAYAATCIH